MNIKRNVEVFIAGCPVCEETVEMVNRIACPSCEVTILDMNLPEVARKARETGVKTVPAVAVNGELLDCCVGGPAEDALRVAGVGDA